MIQHLNLSYGKIFEPALIQEILQVGTFKDVPAGFKLMDIGQYIKGIPLLVSGGIKVLREDHNGDELLLYYLEQGDTCSMTMTCCMGQTKSEIRTIAETDTKLIMIPIQKMEEWTSKYKTWRNFVFESYHNRLNEMLQTIDSIAFDNLDNCLTDYLKDKARLNNSSIIKVTHKVIAEELNSSRVVISRLLKKLENKGHIALHRNEIEIIHFD